jgi:Fic family protein
MDKSILADLPNFPAFTWSQEALYPALMSLRLKQGKLLGKMESLLPEFKNQANKTILNWELESTFQRTGVQANALYEDLIQNYQKPLTLERLKTWLDIIPIVYKINNTSEYNFVNKTKEEQLNQFLVWFNKPGLDRLLKAAIAHLWFVAISPFEKYNEFIAMGISTIQLIKADETNYRYYSFAKQIIAEQDQYSFILSQSLRGSLDITIWLQWFLSCINRAYDASENLLSTTLIKVNFWNKQLNINFNQRQRFIINKLLDGYDEKLTTSVYASLTQCARDTALRDLTALIQVGVIKKAGGLGKKTLYIISL